MLAEAGGIGQLTEDAVALLSGGARNALRYLNVLDGDPLPSTSQVVSRFEWLYSAPGGFWVAQVKTGEQVAQGQTLGEIRDLYGDVVETIAAPDEGVVLFLTTSAAIARTASCSA